MHKASKPITRSRLLVMMTFGMPSNPFNCSKPGTSKRYASRQSASRISKLKRIVGIRGLSMGTNSNDSSRCISARGASLFVRAQRYTHKATRSSPTTIAQGRLKLFVVLVISGWLSGKFCGTGKLDLRNA